MIGLCLLILLSTINQADAFGSIRALLSTQAVAVSILDEVTSELLDRPLAIRELGGILSYHHYDYFYIGCATSSVAYFTLHHLYLYKSFIKLRELPVYINSYKKFRMILFIIILIFIRDVENAI